MIKLFPILISRDTAVSAGLCISQIKTFFLKKRSTGPAGVNVLTHWTSVSVPDQYPPALRTGRGHARRGQRVRAGHAGHELLDGATGGSFDPRAAPAVIFLEQTLNLPLKRE